MNKINKEFDFIKHRKTFAIIAACVLLFGVIFNIIFGVKLDTNFKGGTIYTYSYSGDMDKDAVKSIAASVLGDEVNLSFSKELTGDASQVTMTTNTIPPTVLTYSYTAGEGAAQSVDAEKAASIAAETIGRDASAEIEDGKLVITPSEGARIATSVEDKLTTALGEGITGYTFTLDSSNDVNDVADKLKTELVSNFGTKLVYEYKADSADQAALKTAFEDVLGFSVTVTVDSNEKTVTVVPADASESDGAFSEQSQTDLATVLSDNGLTLKEARYNSVKLITSNSVKPTVGKGFFIKCLVAMVIGALIITIYISLRFRRIGGLSAAMFASLALVHDILISYFVYVVFRIPLDDNFIAVVLTILGYSINGTIVIYDRIRANEKKYGSTKTVSEIVNMSVNGSFTRNVYTSLSTLIAVVAICIIAKIKNLDSIISFAFPMCVGICAGFYSSLFLSSPLWAMWRDHKLKKQAENGGKNKKK